MRSAKNTNVIYTGAVGRKLRPSMRGLLSSKRVAKTAIRLHGGPFNSKLVRLSQNSDLCTLVIACRGQVGRYVRGEWQQVQ